MHIACLTNRETSQNMYQHHQHLLAYDVVNLIFKHQLIARNSNDKTPHVHMYIYMYTHTCICLCMYVLIYICVHVQCTTRAVGFKFILYFKENPTKGLRQLQKHHPLGIRIH